MTRRRMILTGTGIALLTGALGFAPIGAMSTGLDMHATQSDPPGGPRGPRDPVPIIWTEDIAAINGGHDWTSDQAAIHEEQGFDDWRLPASATNVSSQQESVRSCLYS